MSGDYAYFIEEKHFKPDGWTIDNDARTKTKEPTFFRKIINGKQTSSHGWIVDNKIIQWG